MYLAFAFFKTFETRSLLVFCLPQRESIHFLIYITVLKMIRNIISMNHIFIKNQQDQNERSL